jgi:tetratricopeptide (TPR) repeat protein
MNVAFIFLCLGIVGSYLLIRPLATFLHELGHLLALAGTQQGDAITVYLGSLGEHKRGWQFRTGRILWRVHPGVWLMRGSLCDFSHPLSRGRLIGFAIAGPLFSLAFAALAGGLAIAATLEGPVQGLLLLAAVIPLMDVLYALIYRYEPVMLSNQRMSVNDGQTLGWAFAYGKWTDDFLHGLWLFQMDRYAEAEGQLLPMLAAGIRRKMVFECLIYCTIATKKPDVAASLHEEMIRFHKQDALDRCHYILALLLSGRIAQAQIQLENALKVAPGHPESLAMRAELLIRSQDLEAAIPHLNAAIIGLPEFAAAQSNRAWVAIHNKDFESALADLRLSARHDNENPLLHLTWAAYFVATEDHANAQSALESASILGLGPLDDDLGRKEVWKQIIAAKE